MATSARIDELRKKFDENPRRYFAPLANEYRKLGDLEQAIFICQEYLPQQPGHMSGHIVYGQALFEAGRLDEARAVFETALTLDPENLIALRHLGDIAHRGGDVEGARGWYVRVLDVDPRNDEIAGLISSLESAPAKTTGASSTAITVETPAVTIESASATRDMTLDVIPTAVANDEPPPIPVEAAKPDESPPELLDLDDLQVGGFEPTSAPPEPRPAVTSFSHEQQTERANSASPEFSLEGIETTSSQPAESAASSSAGVDDFDLGSASPTTSAPSVSEPPPRPAPRPGVIDAAIEGLEQSHSPTWLSALPSDTPPYADVAPVAMDDFASASPVAEENDSSARTSAPMLDDVIAFDAPEPEASTVPAARAAEPELDADDFDLPETPAPTPVAAGFAIDDGETDSRDDDVERVAAKTTARDEVPLPELDAAIADLDEIESEPAAHDADAVTSAEPFVTETMAELYLRQGHLESALNIYTTLVEQRPGDRELAARRKAVEDRLYGAPSTSAAPHAPRSVGPTIREFLAELLARVWAGGAAPTASGENTDAPDAYETRGYEGNGDAPHAGYDVAFVDDAAVVDSIPDEIEPDEPARPVRPTPGSASETVSGSIDSLFGGAQTADQDVAAAVALSDAFASDPPEAPLLKGMPAHRATNELSLDHVFRAGAPQPEADSGSSFSFDQFFAEGATEPRPTSPADPATGGGTSADDIAQFNAWLSGLKKT